MAQHEILASVRIILPDGPSEMASALGEIATAWGEFVGGLTVDPVETTFDVNQTRTKPTGGNGAGAKRARKPRLPRVSVGDVNPLGLPGPMSKAEFEP